MDKQLWNLFLETGEPMGYLLYKAEERRKEKELKAAGNKDASPAHEETKASF